MTDEQEKKEETEIQPQDLAQLILITKNRAFKELSAQNYQGFFNVIDGLIESLKSFWDKQFINELAEERRKYNLAVNSVENRYYTDNTGRDRSFGIDKSPYKLSVLQIKINSYNSRIGLLSCLESRKGLLFPKISTIGDDYD